MKPSAKFVGVGIAGSIVGLWASTAFAQPPSAAGAGRFPVVIVVPRCVKAPAPDLQRIVSAELGIEVATQLEDDTAAPKEPPGTGPRSHDDPNVTRVTMSCTGPWLRLEVLDPVSGKTLVRHLDLSAHDASTRTRMLGLSAAELVAASWIELMVRPAARPHIVEAKASAAARDAAIGAAQKALVQPSFYRLDAFAAAQRTGSADLLTLGGGIGGSWVHNGWQVVGADFLIESGNQDVPLGTIRTLLTAGSVSLRVRQRLGWVAVEGGLGVRGGVAHMQGEAAEIVPKPAASTATLPWWGPMIMLRLEATIAQRVAFVMGLAGARDHGPTGRPRANGVGHRESVGRRCSPGAHAGRRAVTSVRAGVWGLAEPWRLWRSVVARGGGSLGSGARGRAPGVRDAPPGFDIVALPDADATVTVPDVVTMPDVVIVPDVVTVPDVMPPPDVAPCAAGYAAQFSGASSLSVARPVQDDFTLEAWIETTASRRGSMFYHGNGVIYADAPPGPNRRLQ
jgi:hypothetical protein